MHSRGLAARAVGARLASGLPLGSPRIVAGFALRFFFWLVVLHLALEFSAEVVVSATRNSLPWTTGWRLMAVPGTGDLFQLGGAMFRIIPECTAIPAVCELIAAILATRLRRSWKAWGIVVGTAGLWTLNTVRLMIVGAVMRDWPEGSVFVHYAMQSFMLLSVFALLGAWVVLRPAEIGAP